MIKAQDLRIGNTVLYKCDIIKVTMVGEYGIQSKTENSTINAKFSTPDINGIPITEDILLKLGFEFDEDKYMYFLLFNRSCIYYELEDNIIYIAGDEICKIQYIHQLQNLVHALSQTELPTDKILNS